MYPYLLGSMLQETQLEVDTDPQGPPAPPSPQAGSGRMEQGPTLRAPREPPGNAHQW